MPASRFSSRHDEAWPATIGGPHPRYRDIAVPLAETLPRGNEKKGLRGMHLISACLLDYPVDRGIDGGVAY
jgi:hypothetical protein